MKARPFPALERAVQPRPIYRRAPLELIDDLPKHIGEEYAGPLRECFPELLGSELTPHGQSIHPRHHCSRKASRENPSRDRIQIPRRHPLKTRDKHLIEAVSTRAADNMHVARAR